MSSDLPPSLRQSAPQDAASPGAVTWDDLFQALAFVQKAFRDWQSQEYITASQLAGYEGKADIRRRRLEELRAQGQGVPANLAANLGIPASPGAQESDSSRQHRYWSLVNVDIERAASGQLITLAVSHTLKFLVKGYQSALKRKMESDERLAADDAIELTPVEEPILLEDVATTIPPPMPVPSPVPLPNPVRPRRNIIEILLDPRSIQWLLASGAVLLVVGLVLLLWVNELLTPPVMAAGLGIVNAAVLLCGWWMLKKTRFHVAGRALTLLACLVMPLNLWYYDANGLITLDGHLWAAALVMCVLYAASASVLRDELFVYVFVAGVTMTGLLFLATLPPSPQRLWEIALPSTMLVVLAVLAVLAERAFPEQEGPFSRKRFGLAFFWSGHVLLAAGLLLVLGAQITGHWLYEPVFKSYYAQWGLRPSPIVGELRWLGLALVLVGTVAYVYSDVVVRRIGVYVHLAGIALTWALVLLLEQLHLALGIDALIIVLAAVALAVNVAQSRFAAESRITRALPIMGVVLPLLGVGLGLSVYLRAISTDLRAIWQAAPPSWGYVAAMAATAVSARVAAHLYRKQHARLTLVYFFATGAATLVGATALLAALGLDRWQEHAPLLVLLPIVYVIAARLYRGHSQEQPLVWAAHAATLVMLAGSAVSAFAGFSKLVEGQPLNLALAVFCVEAAVFYALDGAFQRHVVSIHLSAAMACGALWQLLTYAGVSGEYYTLTFALAGLALLALYRFGVLERLGTPRLAEATFQSANALLSISFLAAALLALTRLATRTVQWEFVGLCALLALASLLAVGVVAQTAWRRWYVVTTVGQAMLAFLGVTVLSTLTMWQKGEIFATVAGLVLLIVGHLGWYREQDRENDLVSVCLFFGSLAFGLPTAVATLIDRSTDHFILLNELGFLVGALLLLSTGYMFQLKSTTIVGAFLTALYVVTLLIFVPWSHLNAVAVLITVGGGLLFGLGLILSVYRDRLAQLPDKLKRREGIFRILNWR
ncbi:MAG: hypothetical protein HYS13_05730 [Planctomycetia bacterium]|nr:hypothetical protein [Planctomycetia bacterium]